MTRFGLGDESEVLELRGGRDWAFEFEDVLSADMDREQRAL